MARRTRISFPTSFGRVTFLKPTAGKMQVKKVLFAEWIKRLEHEVEYSKGLYADLECAYPGKVGHSMTKRLMKLVKEMKGAMN